MQKCFRGSKAMTIPQVVIALLAGLHYFVSQSAIAEPTEVQGATSSSSQYAAVEVSPAARFSTTAPVTPDSWAVSGQFTGLSQYHPSFTAPYSGKNSLNSDNLSSATADLTLFAGVRVWSGGELWINPEIDQGFGLSNTIGMAGYSSGEAYKVGANEPYLRIPRLFYRQVLNLGGEEQIIAPAANQLGRTQTANNIILTVGKFSVTDIFDANSYAHDPRADFFNWAVVESGAFDYAADAWGFTKGAAIEWTQSQWTLRGGFFTLSQVPNTAVLDQTFTQHEYVGELEERHQLLEHPGKIKVLAFINQGNFGNYLDALQLVAGSNNAPDTSQVRHYSSRPGIAINLEQEVTSDLGAFMRASKNKGTKEADDFTEINQSIAVGLSLKGDRWARHDDTLGIATVVNALSSDAQAYFAAGGTGILIGDGKLNYGQEKIMETYYAYSVPAVDHLTLTVDYQYVVNPAYNRDRGPVNIFGIRAHKEF